jgi:hypothetical protein
MDGIKARRGIPDLAKLSGLGGQKSSAFHVVEDQDGKIAGGWHIQTLSFFAWEGNRMPKSIN